MDDILWRETYENLLVQGIDKYDAEVIATDMLEEMEEEQNYGYF